MNAQRQADLVDRLRSELLKRFGEDQAITIDQLAIAIGLHRNADGQVKPQRRKCEQLLEEHFGSLGFLIVVSTQKGVYRPIDASEVNHYRNSLKSRCRAAYARLRAINRLAPQAGFIRDGRDFRNRPSAQPDLF